MKKHLVAIVAVAALALSAGSWAQSRPAPELEKAVAAHVYVNPTFAQPNRVAQLLAESAAAGERPLVELRSADQYALRHLKREQPEVTPDWRRCPSV